MDQDNRGLNGSVDLLADAMRRVFNEAVEGAVKPIITEVKAMRTEVRDEMADIKDDLTKKMEDEGKRTRSNVQAQIAEQEKKIAQMSPTKKADKTTQSRPSA